MSKGSKSINNKNAIKGKVQSQAHAESEKANHKYTNKAHSEYLFSMSYAPRINESTPMFQMLPALFFTAVIIMVVRMASYQRPMEQFYFWSANSGSSLTDFFSYFKLIAILVCTLVAIIILMYKVFTQSFYIKRSFAYIPMIVYSLFVLLSYLFSDYKLFALWGWNDRFEGTIALIAYMIMLFFTINVVNSEENVSWLVHLLALVSTILGLLGVTQALNHDFFKTTLGKQLITPPSFWSHIDTLNFTFTNQIYQTVYNINYVSFYLTLLIPIFGLLFIHSVMKGKEDPFYKKILWGALFTLLVFNLIGSASSGGLMGMAFVVLVGIVVLNKKIIKWWKPVIMLIVLTVIVAGASYNRWVPELTGAINGVTGKQTSETNTLHKLDYMTTTGNAIELGYKGDEVIFTTYPDDPSSLTITDSKGTAIAATQTNQDPPEFQLNDNRFSWVSIKPARDSDGNNYIILITDGNEWPFKITNDGPKYRTGTGRFIDLKKAPAVGWENNQAFGSGRGYIWSRTIPMMKETMFLGHGADTFCIYFPHYDYVGKYNSDVFTTSINIIVDKPHNMYFDTIIGTGGISMLALLALWGIYIVQSFILYWKEEFNGLISFVGVGAFLGVCGFLVSGFVNDSNVSVMPMFYGLLGTGIAINAMLKRSRLERF